MRRRFTRSNKSPCGCIAWHRFGPILVRRCTESISIKFGSRRWIRFDY